MNLHRLEPYKIVLEKTNFKRESPSSEWEITKEKTEEITVENYKNLIESIPFFQNFGTERNLYAITPAGRLPVEFDSTSPDGCLRTFRRVRFEVKDESRTKTGTGLSGNRETL